MKAFGKLTQLVDGRPKIRSDPPLVVPMADLLSGAEFDKFEKSIRQTDTHVPS